MSHEPRQRGMTDALLCAGVFAFTFVYRFNTLGGALGGFSNDEFGYLARARQIEAGEVPFRDFNDPGWFLTDALSALAQSAPRAYAGDNEIEEMVVTEGRRVAPAAPPAVRTRPGAATGRPESSVQRRSEKLGTGHGAREWSVVATVPFQRATSWPQLIRRIEYDKMVELAHDRQPRP